MTALVIKTCDKKVLKLLSEMAKQLGATVVVKTEKEQKKSTPKTRTPNADTIDAMNELRTGGGKLFNSAEELFASI